MLSRDAYRLPFHSGQSFASVLASYGCPFSCTFCNTGQLGYKLRPIEETLADMQIVQQMGFRAMYLRDATANGHRESLLELCRAMAKSNLTLQWNTFCTFKPFDSELAQAMSRAGCTVVQMGFETASETLRAQTGKAFDNDSAMAAVRYAHEAGIKVCGHFVLGLPGQDEEDVRNSAT
ncbi:MAG TPA: radical SAM protein, partial [Myxococcales bacterium]|nr:radical SAM protein [Myxococcales bacterium]